MNSILKRHRSEGPEVADATVTADQWFVASLPNRNAALFLAVCIYRPNKFLHFKAIA